MQIDIYWLFHLFLSPSHLFLHLFFLSLFLTVPAKYSSLYPPLDSLILLLVLYIPIPLLLLPHLPLCISLSSLNQPSSSLSERKMKQLIRRLSRVSDSSQYFLLRSDSTSTRTPTRTRRSDKKRGRSVGVPEGHFPVYVGEEMERFVVSAELLSHPIFMELLNQSANEYGYEQQGVLRIPCRVLVFERVLEMLRDGGDVTHFFSQDFL